MGGEEAAAAPAWDAVEERRFAGDDDAMTIDIAGFEGPLDLLLALARTHKVDLAHLSMLALAEQYLDFIADARSLRLEIAADYLVMAAWLTFLKSKLLLPKSAEETQEASGEELALALAFRLRRLQAMREAAAQITARKRLGLDVFARGMPDGVRIIRETAYTASVHDLLSAYARQRAAKVRQTPHVVKLRAGWSIKEARANLERRIKASGEWMQLDLFIDFAGPGAGVRPSPELRRSMIASSFTASLEMTREGVLDLRQDAAFAPIYLRRRTDEDAAGRSP